MGVRVGWEKGETVGVTVDVGVRIGVTEGILGAISDGLLIDVTAVVTLVGVSLIVVVALHETTSKSGQSTRMVFWRNLNAVGRIFIRGILKSILLVAEVIFFMIALI